MEIPDGAGVRVRLSMGFPGRPVQRAQGVAPGVWAAAICSWGPQPPLDLVKMSSAHPTQLLPSQWRDGLEAKATGPCRSEGLGVVAMGPSSGHIGQELGPWGVGMPGLGPGPMHSPDVLQCPPPRSLLRCLSVPPTPAPTAQGPESRGWWFQWKGVDVPSLFPVGRLLSTYCVPGLFQA